jgi:hypothetical protein
MNGPRTASNAPVVRRDGWRRRVFFGGVRGEGVVHTILRSTKEDAMRIMKWAILAVVMLLALQPSFADDRTPILGIWRLVSYEVESQATAEREPVLGKTPTGNIIFTPEGRMMVVITGEGRKAPTTDQDRADLFKSLVAYTGMYHVEGDKWITKVDVAANPAWVGTEQTRSFRVDGDRLQESTAAMQWAVRPDKGIVRFILTYERAK